MDFLRDNGIDIDSAIEILGDIETVDEIMDDFLVEMDERLPLMEDYKNNNDMENYAILVHAIKGDSKYLGFTKLAELSFNHQVKAEENNISYINDNYKELMEEISRILKIVKEYRDM